MAKMLALMTTAMRPPIMIAVWKASVQITALSPPCYEHKHTISYRHQPFPTWWVHGALTEIEVTVLIPGRCRWLWWLQSPACCSIQEYWSLKKQKRTTMMYVDKSFPTSSRVISTVTQGSTAITTEQQWSRVLLTTRSSRDWRGRCADVNMSPLRKGQCDWAGWLA